MAYVVPLTDSSPQEQSQSTFGSTLCDSSATDLSLRVKKSSTSDKLSSGSGGIRFTVIVINIVLSALGAVLCFLGAQIDSYLSWTMNTPVSPPLWWTGIAPIIIGLSGVIAAATGRKKWVVTWVGLASVIGVACYASMSVLGCLDAQRYGVALQIYGQCSDHDERCLCWRIDGSIIALTFASCDHIHHVTTLYLILLVTLLLCVSSGVTATILGCVAAFCVEFCQYKDKTETATNIGLQSPNHLRIPGATSMLSVSLPPSPSCASQLQVPETFPCMSVTELSSC